VCGLQGEGVGGCDIIMSPNSTSDNECECLWGTLNCKLLCLFANPQNQRMDIKLSCAILLADRFHVYVPSSIGSNNTDIEVPVCDDLKGIGNCYGKEYHCTITQEKLCHCE
jgi:hypothetical protein